MQTQIGKWGNSLVVRIPNPYARDLDLREGMDVEVSLVEGGLLLRPKPAAFPLHELLDRITPENVHGETDWGKVEGRESW